MFYLRSDLDSRIDRSCAGKKCDVLRFTTDAFQAGLTNGLRYLIVDMCGDSGLGEVLTKNVLLLINTSGERLAFTKRSFTFLLIIS